MPSSVPVVVPPTYFRLARQFFEPAFQEQLRALRLPSILPARPEQFGVPADALKDRRAAPASFGAWTTPPHVLLRPQFFDLTPAKQLYVLAHELKHAELWEASEWQAFFDGRTHACVRWREFTRPHDDKAVFDYFSAPLELAIETWTRLYFAAEWVIQRETVMRYFRSAMQSHQRIKARTHVPSIVLDLVPEAYRFRHFALPPGAPHAKSYRTHSQNIVAFISRECASVFQLRKLSQPLEELLATCDPLTYVQRAEAFLKEVCRP